MYDNEVKFVATFFSLPCSIGSRIYNLRLFSQWSVVYLYPTNHGTIGVRAPPKDNDNSLVLDIWCNIPRLFMPAATLLLAA